MNEPLIQFLKSGAEAGADNMEGAGAEEFKAWESHMGFCIEALKLAGVAFDPITGKTNSLASASSAPETGGCSHTTEQSCLWADECAECLREGSAPGIEKDLAEALRKVLEDDWRAAYFKQKAVLDRYDAQ